MKRNVPAQREEEGLTAAVVWLAEESRTADLAKAGTEAALNEGMHFEQEPKNLIET